MGSHVKEKEVSSFDKKELEEQIVIPLKQMIQEDEDEDEVEEENCIGETVTRLTGNVCSSLHIEQCIYPFSPPASFME
jgi:hypothetical protein